MRNIYDVLKQKEAEIQQLHKDIETLRAAARLLDGESDESGESFLAINSNSNKPTINSAPVLRQSAPVVTTKAADATYATVRASSLPQFP